MLSIFLREDGMVCWYLPIYAETIIQDGDAAICLWVIEVIALVLEDCGLAEDSKATRDEELAMIILSQFYCYVLTICRRTLANIYCDIKYRALNTAYQLGLSIWWALEVQTTHHSIAAHRLVVLTEVNTLPFLQTLAR